MATHFQNAPFTRNINMGESSSVDLGGRRIIKKFAGADPDGNANVMVPVTDVSAHAPSGLSLVATADVINGVAKMALFPMTIMTDNVDSGNPPEAVADNKVYCNDSGEWTDSDDDASSVSFGSCIEVKTSGTYSGYYVLNLTGPDYDT
jgi:hypothetical protein